MQLINSIINLTLAWSVGSFIAAGVVDSQQPTFVITDTKLNVLVVTLLTEDYAKLLQQLKLRFERLTGISISQKQQYKY